MASNPSLLMKCNYCGNVHELVPCNNCKVKFYCKAEHKDLDLRNHSFECNTSTVSLIQQILRTEERELRRQGAKSTPPQDFFEKEVGNFAILYNTTQYMSYRGRLVSELLRIQHPYTLDSALKEAMYTLRLGRGLGPRGVEACANAAGVLLRLGRIQECHDILKGYAATIPVEFEILQPTRRVGNLVLDTKNTDVFEAFNAHEINKLNLSLCATLILLKYKLLRDVKGLQYSAVLSSKVPQEILDKIRGYLVDEVVSKNHRIMKTTDFRAIEESLKSQIQAVNRVVLYDHPRLWPELADAQFFRRRPSIILSREYSMAEYRKYMALIRALENNLEAWLQTRGAIDYVARGGLLWGENWWRRIRE